MEWRICLPLLNRQMKVSSKVYELESTEYRVSQAIVLASIDQYSSMNKYSDVDDGRCRLPNMASVALSLQQRGAIPDSLLHIDYIELYIT